jgi:hypothetical protein
MCCYRLICLFWCFTASLGYTAFVVTNAEQKHWLRIPHSHISDRDKNNDVYVLVKDTHPPFLYAREFLICEIEVKFRCKNSINVIIN